MSEKKTDFFLVFSIFHQLKSTTILVQFHAACVVFWDISVYFFLSKTKVK